MPMDLSMQYLIESVGLNPSIGWPVDKPTVNIVCNQKTAKDLEYLLNALQESQTCFRAQPQGPNTSMSIGARF
jgi:hypothetical protein